MPGKKQYLFVGKQFNGSKEQIDTADELKMLIMAKCDELRKLHPLHESISSELIATSIITSINATSNKTAALSIANALIASKMTVSSVDFGRILHDLVDFAMIEAEMIARKHY